MLEILWDVGEYEKVLIGFRVAESNGMEGVI